MLSVNGQKMPAEGPDGYATLHREWKAGEVIALALPMPVRRVVTHEHVEADRGLVGACLTRTVLEAARHAR